MSTIADVDCPCLSATDGEIAAINLESARRRAWVRFARDPRRRGLAEAVVDQERLTMQFLGDLSALDRVEQLASQFEHVDDSFRTALVQADVASTAHRFADARDHLARAALMHGPRDEIERHSLSIDQACGVELEAVLATRRRIASARGRLEDLVPLGAVLADLARFPDADAVYRQALYSYSDVSPFPPAWVCFQLGILWGELVPVPDPTIAARWYQSAISYFPGYVKARIHLAEIHVRHDQTTDAEALLLPALSSGDPEVRWRLADLLIAQERFEEAEIQLDVARVGFNDLLDKHFLAFADHAAEFYAGSGNDCGLALELACANVINRPTRSAVAQAHAIAMQAKERCTLAAAPRRPANQAADRHRARARWAHTIGRSTRSTSDAPMATRR